MEEIAPASASLKPIDDAPTLKDNPQSPLLCLPGELRNHIYAYIVNGTTQRLKVPLRYLDFEASMRRPAEKYDDQWFKTYGCRDWGLTQVCRRIRSEYLPIHKTHTTYEVPLIGVEAYTNNWILGGGSIEGKEVIGNLVILTGMNIYCTESTDILPLIHLCGIANSYKPRLSVSVRGYWDSDPIPDRNDLESLFHVNNNPKWKGFLENYVSQIIVGKPARSILLEVKLIMRPAYLNEQNNKTTRFREFCREWEKLAMEIPALRRHVTLRAEDEKK